MDAGDADRVWVNNTFKFKHADTRAGFLRATFLVTAKEMNILYSARNNWLRM